MVVMEYCLRLRIGGRIGVKQVYVRALSQRAGLRIINFAQWISMTTVHVFVTGYL